MDWVSWGVRETRKDRLIAVYRRKRKDTHKEVEDKMSNKSKNIW